MFDQFPKSRPPLPKEIAQIYSGYFKANRGGRTPATSLSQRMEVWLHKKVAEDLKNEHCTLVTLEVGAGTLNQLQYEPEVGPYDIVEPSKELYEDSSQLHRIRNFYADIKEIPNDLKYDRITSIATFEHICNLPEVIAKCGLGLKRDGTLRVSIPSEGTPLWTLGWKLTTGLEFKIKYGFDYGLIRKYDHVNTAKEIETLLEYFFAEVDSQVLGIARFLSLYQFYACKRPFVERCLEFAAN